MTAVDYLEIGFIGQLLAFFLSRTDFSLVVVGQLWCLGLVLRRLPQGFGETAGNALTTAATLHAGDVALAALVPIGCSRTNQQLNPRFLVFFKLSQGGGNGRQRIDLKTLESFNWQRIVRGHLHFGNERGRKVSSIVHGVIRHFANLHRWILGINLLFDEIFQVLGHPHIKTDPLANNCDFKTQTFTTRWRKQLGGWGRQQAVQTGKHLLGGQFFFVIGSGHLQQ